MKTINKRFFAYGCSFTSYPWPTWADILGRQYNEYYNYGQPGAGNIFIFNALMESDQYHKITKDDIVVVQWSCSSRDDRYKNKKWQTPGGVANYMSQKEFLKFFDFRGFVIRDVAAMKATQKFLDAIGCEYYFISMVPFITNNMYKDLAGMEVTNDVPDVAEVYKDVVDIIKPSFVEILGDYGKTRPKILYGVKIEDSHPIPSEHYKYLAEVLPHLAVESSDYINELDRKLSEIYNIMHKKQKKPYRWPDIERGITNIKERL